MSIRIRSNGRPSRCCGQGEIDGHLPVFGQRDFGAGLSEQEGDEPLIVGAVFGQQQPAGSLTGGVGRRLAGWSRVVDASAGSAIIRTSCNGPAATVRRKVLPSPAALGP